MEKKVKIGEKEITVKEFSYLDAIDVQEKIQVNFKEGIKAMVIASTGLNEEEIGELTAKDGIRLQNIINEVNGFADFQTPTEQIELNKK